MMPDGGGKMAGKIKSNTAMITALVLGVHCCLPGMVAKAEEKSTDAVSVQTDGGMRELFGKSEGNILQGDLGFGDPPEDILDNQELLLKYKEVFGENTNIIDRGISGNDDSGLITNTQEESETVVKELPEDEDKELQNLEDKTGDEKKSAGNGVLEKDSLQMPQKLEVVIDPWEIDGKGQVYSDEYVIKNTGEDTGILTLSGLTCKPREKSGVIVRTDRNGLHDDKRKSIYMEIVFGTGERIALTEEGAGYETELKPGKEVSLQFAGEVNENASGSWNNEDIAVEAVYSWEVKENKADTSGDISDSDDEGIDNGDISQDASGDAPRDKSGDASGDAPRDKSGDASENISGDIVGDVSGDLSGDISGETSGNVSEDRFREIETSGDAADGSLNGSTDTDREELSGDSQAEEVDSWKDKLRSIELDKSGDAEIEVDSWKETEDEDAVSMWYILHNTGKTAGILTLPKTVCIETGQDELTARMRPGSEESLQGLERPDCFVHMVQREPQNAEKSDESGYIEDKYVLMDLIPEDGESQTVGDENQEKSGYQFELKPGEGVKICFSARLDERTVEELKSGKAVVKARYSWIWDEEPSGGYED